MGCYAGLIAAFLSAWPGVKAELFFPRNRGFQHLLEGRKDVGLEESEFAVPLRSRRQSVFTRAFIQRLIIYDNARQEQLKCAWA